MPTLLLEPNVCAHGAQSTRIGGSSFTNGSASAYMTWFELSIRWVLTTALGWPVEPDVSRNLAIPSGVMAARAARASGEIAVSASAENGVAPKAPAVAS